MSDYTTNTVPQLKEILKERGLPVDGKKADLVARLTENDASSVGTSEVKEDVKEPEPAPVEQAEVSEAVSEPVEAAKAEEKVEGKPKPKVLSPEERKTLAVDLLTKKIKRAEKFGDEASAEVARKDLARIEKFGVEPGTALAKEIGLVDKSFNNGLSERSFKKSFKKGKKFHKR